MKEPFLPPPEREGLRGLRVHEAIRDFPEALPLFRRWGLRLQEQGGEFLDDVLVLAEDREDDLLRVLDWRRGAPADPGGPGSGGP